MDELMIATTALTALNALLLGGLLYVYLQNYAKIKSTFTIGLMVFTLLFLLQALVSLYYYYTMMPYYAKEVEPHVLIITALQTVAFAVMNWITWK